MALLDLPTELLYEILDNLSGNSKALVSCSLTCRAFRTPCQTSLLSTVELHLHTSVLNLGWPQKDHFTKESKLLSTLEENPALIPFVHNVSIYDLFGGEELIFGDPELNADIVQNLFGRNESALLLLGLLENVRTVKIFAYNTRSWTSLAPAIQTAIRGVFQYPHLSRIDIHAMSAFPISLVQSSAGSLKHVSVSTFPTLRLAYEAAAPRPSISPPVSLESLHLSTSTPDLENFVKWIPSSNLDVKGLTRLVVRTLGDKHKGVQPLVWKLVGECASTLKELDFFAYLPYGRTDISSDSVLALYDTIDLGSLPSLRRLTVRYWLTNVSDTNHQLTLLARLLRSMKGAVQLAEIALHFVIIHSRVPLDPTGSQSWEVLDSAIVDCAPPMLAKVSVKFESIPDQHREECVEMVEAGLYRLRGRGMLDIQSLSSSPRFIPFSH